MEKLVVVGAGMASGRALEHIFEEAPGRFDVTLFGAEPRGNYNRLMLSPVLAGEKEYEQIITHDAEWYRDHGVHTRFGETVTGIDRARKVVVSKDGETPYDKLIIATGSGLGRDDFATGIWPMITMMPLIGLPIGFVLIITLLVVSAVRRGRAAKDAGN
mgnify:CR=1 FL=1